ncbi:MAG TPA: hypothetical protein VFG20_09225 [Planctomycetaceae bacterium]|nr:hypothetical protein [Planctomycetaceae bacterium]
MSSNAEITGRTLWRVVPIGLWVATVIAVFLAVWRYDSLAGSRQTTPVRWPAASGLTLQSSGTCVMFAHPRCPCTRASLQQLQDILSGKPNWHSVQVVLFQPRSASPDWKHSDIVRTVDQMPRVLPYWDEDGRVAALFGAETSGHVVLYDADGRLQFSGGITGLRGHIGPNLGAESLAAIGRGETAANRSTPVYGCSLITPDSGEKSLCEVAP